jgi:HSP20 family protein
MNPFEEIREEMNRLFGGFLGRAPMRTTAEEGCILYPAVDVEDEADKYVLKAELPGLKKDDLKVTVSDGSIVLSGEKKAEHEEKHTGFHRYERCYGKFQRAFMLPTQVDANKIKANFKDGILEIDIPKSAEAKPKEIEIKAS